MIRITRVFPFSVDRLDSIDAGVGARKVIIKATDLKTACVANLADKTYYIYTGISGVCIAAPGRAN